MQRARRFKVLLHGYNFIVDNGSGPELSGFYANRFVEAISPEDAVTKASEVVLADSDLMSRVVNMKADPPKIEAEEVDEYEEFPNGWHNKGGYAFYYTDDEDSGSIN